MDKISAYTSTADVNDEFTEGDPSTGTPATEVDGGWLNGVQRELLEIMTQMGLTPSSADDTLVWQAVQAVYGKTFSGDPNGNVAANVVHERCWDTSTSPSTLYIATAADGTTGGTTWTRFTDLLRAASTTQRGIVELATTAEAQAGTDTQRAVTPAGVAAVLSGALIPIAQATASSDAAIDFTSGIDGTYGVYLITLDAVTPVSDNSDFWMRTSTDAGANWDSGSVDYVFAGAQFRSDGATDNRSSTGSDKIIVADSCGGAAGESLQGAILLFNPSGGADKTHVAYDLVWIDQAGIERRAVGGGRRDAAEDVTGIRFLYPSGNIASGRFRLYGVKKS